jgi:hypothetical protein
VFQFVVIDEDLTATVDTGVSNVAGSMVLPGD